MPKLSKMVLQGINEELKDFKRWMDNQHDVSYYRKYGIKKLLGESTKHTRIVNAGTICKLIGKRPSKITEKDVERYEKICSKRYSPNSVKIYFVTLNKMLEWLGHPEWRLKTPVGIEREYPVFTDEERSNITDVVKTLPAYEKAIMTILMEGVCRPSEVVSIKLRNMRLKEHKIILSSSKTGRYITARNEEDVIYTTPAMETAIMEWIEERESITPRTRRDVPYLFISPYHGHRGKKIGYPTVWRLVKMICYEAGIDQNKKISPYTFKRTEITREFDRGVNPRVIQKRARHKDISTTLRYNHKIEKDIVDYLHSPQYTKEVEHLPFDEQVQLLAEKVVKGEMPWEIYQQIRSDLEQKHRVKGGEIGYV